MNDKNQISDELLAAFLDGNTNAEDTMRVLNAAEQDMELQEIIRIASEVDEDMAITVKPTIIPMTAMAAKKKETYLCDIECEEFVLHQFYRIQIRFINLLVCALYCIKRKGRSI